MYKDLHLLGSLVDQGTDLVPELDDEAWHCSYWIRPPAVYQSRFEVLLPEAEVDGTTIAFLSLSSLGLGFKDVMIHGMSEYQYYNFYRESVN